jgi:hypothetical protein
MADQASSDPVQDAMTPEADDIDLQTVLTVDQDSEQPESQPDDEATPALERDAKAGGDAATAVVATDGEANSAGNDDSAPVLPIDACM